VILGDKLFFAQRAYNNAEFEGVGEIDGAMEPVVVQ